MNVGNERDPAELLAMVADGAPFGPRPSRASTPLIPAPASYIQQERERYGQQQEQHRTAQPHPQHVPLGRSGPVPQPSQNQALNFHHVSIHAPPSFPGAAGARPQSSAPNGRARHRSEETARVPTSLAQPFIPPRSQAQSRGSATDRPQAPDTHPNQVPNNVLIDVIRMLAENRNQAGSRQQATNSPQPSTSGVAVSSQQLQRPAAQMALPQNYAQATPFPDGWPIVALPSRRLIGGILTKAKPPSFCLAHYAVIQQSRLGKITEVNAQSCRDSSYLKLMQKVGLDILSVQNNVEVKFT